MNAIFHGPIAGELHTFLEFKRSLGFGYGRAEFALREFDRFLSGYVKKKRRWGLDQAALTWLSSKPNRKPVSVSMDAAILRQLFAYLRRLPHLRVVEPRWPRLPTESCFVPHYLSEGDVVKLVGLCSSLNRPAFRASLYRALVLILYCTGIRFGEALRLRMRDVDTRSAVLFIETFKGRARWVPFHRSLARELDRYLTERVGYAPIGQDARFFVGGNQRNLPVSTAHSTLHGLFAEAGLKPEKGRVGPRPYDLRHAFAVQRLTLWYRQGVDLHTRLPWLSAYMGHVDIVGTESYLNATPELLALAAHRLHRRYRKDQRGGSTFMSREKPDSLLALTQSFFVSYLQSTRGAKRSHRARVAASLTVRRGPRRSVRAHPCDSDQARLPTGRWHTSNPKRLVP